MLLGFLLSSLPKFKRSPRLQTALGFPHCGSASAAVGGVGSGGSSSGCAGGGRRPFGLARVGWIGCFLLPPFRWFLFFFFGLLHFHLQPFLRRRKSKPSFDDSFPKLSPYQMEKFLVAAPPPSGDAPAAPVPPRCSPLPRSQYTRYWTGLRFFFRFSDLISIRRRHRWSRVAAELDGRIDARFRHRESVRLRDSFSEVTEISEKSICFVSVLVITKLFSLLGLLHMS